MKRVVLALGIVLVLGLPLAAQDCQSVLLSSKLPRKAKTQGSPKMVKWEVVDKVLNQVTAELQGKACRFTFGELFKVKDDGVLFPLTNSLIRIVPESSLVGLAVTTEEGNPLGRYEGRVLYEHTGGGYAKDRYQLYHFQYQDSSGEMHAVGKQLLMGSFGVEWGALKDKVAISTQ